MTPDPDPTYGHYSTPRECPLCGFVTTSRADYWRHYFTKHDDPDLDGARRRQALDAEEVA